MPVSKSSISKLKSSSSSSQKKTSTNGNAAVRASTLRAESPPPAKKLKPLSFARPPVFNVESPLVQESLSDAKGGSLNSPSSARKGKGKAKEEGVSRVNGDQLWVDLYAPQTEADLAVHSRKVGDVGEWLKEAFEGGPSGKLRKYRRILALTGPAGTAKTTTVRVLARKLGFEIIEWKNSAGPRYGDDDDDSMMEQFQAFLLRASTCRSVFGAASSDANDRQIILLEDLPNILHSETQTQFHEALQLFVQRTTAAYMDAAPLVIVISDAGLRGESGDDTGAGHSTWGSKEVIDVRSVVPLDLLHSPYVTQIKFNPIAPTLMKKGLNAILDTHFGKLAAGRPPKDIVELIAESSNGDIRSAIMALQFACVVDIVTDKKGKKKGTSGNRSARAVLEAVTRREQSLALFHLIGKVLYNKRRGDPPGASASKKDIEHDRLLDAGIKDPPELPNHLQEHERPPSRVDVNVLYADAPIESSLFSLYIEQNYTQFCNEVDECEGVSEWLSWVDWSGPEEWYQANPHRFHLLTLGTLHCLPTPVARRSQKFYKPEFFERLKRERESSDAVREVQGWLTEEEVPLVGWWTKDSISLELGAVLKAREQSDEHRPPSSHKAFSSLAFTRDGGRMSQLAEDDNESQASAEYEGQWYDRRQIASEAEQGGWLEGDDIEDF